VIVCVQFAELEHKCAVLESMKSSNVSLCIHACLTFLKLLYNVLFENMLSTQECKLCVVGLLCSNTKEMTCVHVRLQTRNCKLLLMKKIALRLN